MGIKLGSVEINEEEKYRLILDFTYDWEEWRGPSGELLYISPSCEHITGYPNQSFLSDPNFLTSIIHPQDLSKYLQHRKVSLLQETETSQMDFRIIHKDGEERWINHYCVPVFHDDGTWIGRRESNRDITQRIKTELELHQTKQQLEIILANISTIVFGLDKDDRLIYANQAAADAAGFDSPQALIEHGTILDKFEIMDLNNQPLPLVHMPIEEAVTRMASTNLTIRYRRLDNPDYCQAILSGRPIYSPDGDLDMLVVIAQDITTLKNTQLELQKSRDDLEKRVEERTRALEKINQDLLTEIAARNKIEMELQQERDFSQSLIQTAQVGLLVLDKYGKILQMNPFLEEVSGYSLEEVKGSDWFETFLIQEDQETTKELFLKAVDDIQTRGNFTPIRTKHGEIRYMEWHDKTLRDQQGNLQGLLSIGQDVTERKAIEEKVFKNATRAEAQANITSRINANLDLNTVLSSVCEELVKAIPAIKTSAIMLANPENEERLSFAAGYGSDLGLRDQLRPVPISNYYNDLLAYGTLRVVLDIDTIEQGTNLAIAKKIKARTVINAIMVHQEKIVGIIHLITHQEPYAPTEEDLSFIQSLANHATIAIVNARLFQQVSENQQRLQSLSQRLVKLQETERRNISRELHDEIGQELTSLILLLEVIKNTCRNEISPENLTYQKIDNAQELVNILLRQIRELALDLRPGLLDDLGLLPALLMHLDRYTQQTDIKVNLKHHGLDRRFSGEIETTSFRIIQEALTNVARHSQVKHVDLRLWVEDSNLNIQVQDNGAGFDPEEILHNSTSIGLLGMQERAALCGGSLEIEAQPGIGTCIMIEIPLLDEFQDEIYGFKNTDRR